MTSTPSDTGPRDKRGAVAVVTSAHGVRGQVKIRSFTGDPEDILSHKTLSDASGKRNFRLIRRGVTHNLLIVSIEGIDDRNAAELLKGTQLFAPESSRKPGKSNQWTYGELTGLEARLANGKTYGKVIGVYNFGAGDIIEIELSGGKTEMLPFTNEYTGEVKADQGYLIVIPPEYVEGKDGDE